MAVLINFPMLFKTVGRFHDVRYFRTLFKFSIMTSVEIFLPTKISLSLDSTVLIFYTNNYFDMGLFYIYI